MNPQRKPRLNASRRALRAVVDEIGPDDGVDPRLDARRRARRHRRPDPSTGSRAPGRKARQLGGQVAETIAALIEGEAADDRLSGLRVARVDPDPDASRLLVTLEGALDPAGPTPAERRAALDRAAGWIRAEVAASIHRKRMPLLAFRLAVADAP